MSWLLFSQPPIDTSGKKGDLMSAKGDLISAKGDLMSAKGDLMSGQFFNDFIGHLGKVSIKKNPFFLWNFP